MNALVRAGVDVNKPDGRQHRTPLMWAIIENNDSVTRLLLNVVSSRIR